MKVKKKEEELNENWQSHGERQDMGGDCEPFGMCASFVQAHYSPSALD